MLSFLPEPVDYSFGPIVVRLMPSIWFPYATVLEFNLTGDVPPSLTARGKSRCS